MVARFISACVLLFFASREKDCQAFTPAQWSSSAITKVTMKNTIRSTSPNYVGFKNRKHYSMKYLNTPKHYSFILRASPEDGDDDEEKPVNPYADPNYPDVSTDSTKCII